MNIFDRTFASVAALLFVCTVTEAQTSTLRLTPEQAVALALEHDLELQRDRIGPQIADLDVRASLTAWTPELSTRVFDTSSEIRQWPSEVALSQRLPWGSSYRLSWEEVPQDDTGVAATFVQPLLRGLTFDDARAERGISLRMREMADTDLAAAHAATKREVLHAYWRWAFAHDYLAVQRQSLAMAQALLDGNRARVEAGAMAAVDVIEADAEVARRAEDILIAEKNVANAEERLRLHLFDPLESSSDVELVPEVSPGERSIPSDATRHALAERRDLESIRTLVAIDAIHVRRFRNDALPDLSVLMSYSQHEGSTVGFAVCYPLGTARAEAETARASLQRRQREAALRAAEARVVVEVNAAVREFETNSKRLETSAKSVALAERRLDAEQRKFASGLSTSFFVFQAQRDLSEAREAQLQSVLDYRLATADVEAVQVIPLQRR